jgi:hypothetical protein
MARMTLLSPGLRPPQDTILGRIEIDPGARAGGLEGRLLARLAVSGRGDRKEHLGVLVDEGELEALLLGRDDEGRRNLAGAEGLDGERIPHGHVSWMREIWT